MRTGPMPVEKNTVWTMQCNGDVCGDHFREKIQSQLRECPPQVACGQSRSCQAENLFNGPKLYWSLDRTPGRIPHDHRAAKP